MRASELMQGDYITFKDSVETDETPMPIKVIGLGYVGRGIENEALVEIDGDKSGDIIEINEECVGIPLTEAFLQKNFPTHEEIVWWPLKDGSFRVEMQDDTHLIIGKYNYAHELQHALRLFGKDGEIKL